MRARSSGRACYNCYKCFNCYNLLQLLQLLCLLKLPRLFHLAKLLHRLHPSHLSCLLQVDWERWFYSPGMPPVASSFPDTLGGPCTEVAEQWMAELSESDDSFEAEQYAKWPSQLQIHFLETLLARSLAAPTPPMSRAALRKMDALYSLSKSKNSEVRCRWQRLCIRHREPSIVPQVVAFVKEVGRMKYVRPLYRELYAWEEQRDVAVEAFLEWRQNYHPIAAKMLAQDLHISS